MLRRLINKRWSAPPTSSATTRSSAATVSDSALKEPPVVLGDEFLHPHSEVTWELPHMDSAKLVVPDDGRCSWAMWIHADDQNRIQSYLRERVKGDACKIRKDQVKVPDPWGDHWDCVGLELPLTSEELERLLQQDGILEIWRGDLGQYFGPYQQRIHLTSLSSRRLWSMWIHGWDAGHVQCLLVSFLKQDTSRIRRINGDYDNHEGTFDYVGYMAPLTGEEVEMLRKLDVVDEIFPGEITYDPYLDNRPVRGRVERLRRGQGMCHFCDQFGGISWLHPNGTVRGRSPPRRKPPLPRVPPPGATHQGPVAGRAGD